MHSALAAAALAVTSMAMSCREPAMASPAAVEPTRVQAERGVAEPPASEPPLSEPPPSEPPPSEPAPPPAPLQVLAPLETPFSPTAIIVLPLEISSPVVLFPDELAAVRARVARSLAARGHEVVPVAELERIEAAAAQGRLVLEGDQTCQAPLTQAEVRSRYFPGRGSAFGAAFCLDDCRLTVVVEGEAQPAGGSIDTSYESRPITRPHDPKAWVSAAERLHTTETMALGGIGLIGIGGPVPPIRFNPPDGIGPWAGDEPTGRSFEPIEPRASGCAHPDPLVGFRWDVLASVDRKGHVQRCAAHSRSSLARPVDGECLCRSMEALELGAGRAGRRLWVQAVDDGELGSAGRFGLLQPGTEAWVGRIDDSPVLERCAMNRSLPLGFSARVTLSLAPDGTVDEVNVEGDITKRVEMSFASCLVSELRRVPLPCRPPGIDELQLSLSFAPR